LEFEITDMGTWRGIKKKRPSAGSEGSVSINGSTTRLDKSEKKKMSKSDVVRTHLEGKKNPRGERTESHYLNSRKKPLPFTLASRVVGGGGEKDKGAHALV